jgi:uncharacterized SAM-binding protein YcdF (DUF218 family)
VTRAPSAEEVSSLTALPRVRWQAGRVPAGALLGALAGFFARDLGLAEIASAWVPGGLAGALVAGCGGLAVVRAATAAAGLVWLAAAFTPLAAWTAQGLTRRDTLGAADAVLVLGSRLQSDGEATAVAQARLLHAIEVLRGGWAPRLIVTELPAPAPSHAALARASLRRLGLPHEVASVGPVARTRDEAVRVAQLCREKGWRRLIVVTSPMHSRRACAALESEGVAVLSSPAPETLYDLEHLDRPPERLKAFASALHERAGIWLYTRRGWMRAP